MFNKQKFTKGQKYGIECTLSCFISFLFYHYERIKKFLLKNCGLRFIDFVHKPLLILILFTVYLIGKKIDKKNKMKVIFEMRNIDLQAEIEYENLKVCNPHIRENQNKYYYAIEPEFEKIDKELLKIIKGKIVLEVGCSTGILAEKFSRNARKYLGVDISN